MDLILETYGNDFEPGDVVVHNDPYRGGGHQADVVVARPLFYKDQLIGFGINRGHWLDIGGMTPGGWSGTAQHVVQEAVLIPPVKLYKAGRLDREIRDLILSNVRIPRLDWGDLSAQLASSVVAERRMQALIDKYGLGAVKHAEELALNYARKRFLSRLELLPEGSWSAEEVFEDHPYSANPLFIRCTVTKSENSLVADFAGTDGQVFAPINNSLVNTKAAAYIAAISLIDPGVPINSGLFDLIHVRAPEGSLVNATWPAPLFFGPADPTNKACEVVIRALAQAIPERVVAGSYQTGNNTTGSGVNPRTGIPFQWFLFGPGGCGARRGRDGNSAEWHVCSNCKNESIELWEHRVPVEFQEFTLVQDSGGPGRTRGGLGYRRRLRLLADTQVSATADRHKIGAWGLEGGWQALPNRFAVGRSGREYRLNDLFDVVSPSKFANVQLRAGDEYIVESGGGGGFGNPSERDRAEILRDVEYGYVSAESAERDYGIDPSLISSNVQPAAPSTSRHPGRGVGG
jgi:N-methylhydantoinase B/oxoprolinase/acetone carboxylase alpha subunit